MALSDTITSLGTAIINLVDNKIAQSGGGANTEQTTNKVTSISSSATDTQYPSAKSIVELLKILYPPGSIYISTTTTCPLASFFGTWELIQGGLVLQTGDGTSGTGSITNSTSSWYLNTGSANKVAYQGLPNVSGKFGEFMYSGTDNTSAPFTYTANSTAKNGGSSAKNKGYVSMSLSNYTSIYGNGVNVQPNAYLVNVWRRTVGTTANSSIYLGCVLYNTPILMADGIIKEAKDVKIGDILQTYNEDIKIFEPNKVLNVFKNRKDDIIKVSFEDDSYIELTSGHPFLTERGWASYDNAKTRKENLYNGAELYQLEVGDKCLTQDGTYLEITNIEYENLGIVDVYDYTIENAHTFIGGGKILHNVASGGG